MVDDDFDRILRKIRLPLGKLLADGRTFRVTRKDFTRLDCVSRNLLFNFDKFLVLSDGEGHVVGGVLFYGRFDLQAQMLAKYKGHGCMSAIHRNGVLKAELYPKQEVSISEFGILSVDDFNMKCHLLSLIGLKARNEDVLRRELLPLYEDGTIRVINISELGEFAYE